MRKGKIEMDVLSVNGLVKVIGKHRILNDISFHVGKQEIVGFLGPNGSGKSTTIKCICGLYEMTAGKITVCGYNIEKERNKALAKMSVSIESPALYPQLTGREHLRLMGTWRKVGKERIDQMAAYTGLGKDLDKKTQGYSMGMKMRLMLAITLMAKPSLIILDEPTNGLDPQAVFQLRREMEQIRQEGSSILFSSHQLSEVEKLADRVVILDRGEKIYDGKIHSYMTEGTEYRLLVSNMKIAQQVLSSNNILYKKMAENWLSISVMGQDMLQNVLSVLMKEKIGIHDVVKCETDLETFYKRLYQLGEESQYEMFDSE